MRGLTSVSRYKILPRLIRLLSPLLQTCEAAVLRRLGEASTYPPLFIVGPPRSGTTLLYQLLVARYGFAYFSNFSAMFPHTPVLALWIEKKLFPRGNRTFHFDSEYGKTRGWHGPHECGEFWYRWFPRGERVYVAPGDTEQAQLNDLARAVRRISAVARSSVIFKNVYNSMRIAPIVEALPQAAFLLCRRNLVDTAQSILRSRVESGEGKAAWWSLPPKEISEIKTHPYWQQVVEQAYYTYQQIEEDRHRFGSERFLDVEYERLCRQTQDTLDSIECFLARRGVNVEARGRIPASFRVSTRQKVSDEDYERIRAVVAQLEGH